MRKVNTPPNTMQVEMDFTMQVRFNGADYDHERDVVRLGGQLERIYNLMKDGQFRTLDEISQFTGDPPASISAQLRHLRKKRFGEHKVEREYIRDGLYKYKLILNQSGMTSDLG